MILENIIKFLETVGLFEVFPYFENVTYLVALLISLTIIIFLAFGIILKRSRENKENVQERKKPVLDDIINEKSIPKVNDENDFVDVLVAIEEEMAAVRELYTGGYISKGVYISETDRLYEKAKIFGL